MLQGREPLSKILIKGYSPETVKGIDGVMVGIGAAACSLVVNSSTASGYTWFWGRLAASCTAACVGMPEFDWVWVAVLVSFRALRLGVRLAWRMVTCLSFTRLKHFLWGWTKMLVFVWINELYNVNTNENYYKLKNYVLSMLYYA